MPAGNIDYGDLILEIDKLIIADRASLSSQASESGHAGGSARNSQTFTHGAPSSFAQREGKPKPTIWQQQLPIMIAPETPSSPDGRGGGDMRQVRLFKTRFCSYGLDCPYMTKGKCLYAHTKDEIRLRPPPPTVHKLPSSRSVVAILKDDQQAGGDSVWTLPESPTSYSLPENSRRPARSVPSLLDCLASDASRVPSVSSILGGASIDC